MTPASNIKTVVLSGIRATGKLHVGNYFGAIRNFLTLQADPANQCCFFIADYHTLTTNPNPNALRHNLIEVALDYLAAGIDPQRSMLYVQSSIPEIAELTLLLSMVEPIGELMRCTTFKEKARKQPDNVNLGLLSYPVLMAADILGPRAHVVPVGEDQLQHVEMARQIARRFNKIYGETFPEPSALLEEAIRVPGLDGSGKMGKSEGNTIDLNDPPDEVWKKVRVAVTDPARRLRTDPGTPDRCNLYALHGLTHPGVRIAEIDNACRTATIGCVECKRELADHVNVLLAPMRERRQQLAKDLDYVRDVLRDCGRVVRSRVQETVAQTRERMGLPTL